MDRLGGFGPRGKGDPMYIKKAEIMSAYNRAATIDDPEKALKWMTFFLLRIGAWQEADRAKYAERHATEFEEAMAKLGLNEDDEPAEPEGEWQKASFMEYVEKGAL